MIYGEFAYQRSPSNAQFKYIGRDWAEYKHGFVAAHDMMEHFPDDQGTIEDELRALGAGMVMRLQSHMSEASALASVASDLVYTIEHFKVTELKPIAAEYSMAKVGTKACYLNLWPRLVNEAAKRIPTALLRRVWQWAIVGEVQARRRYADHTIKAAATFEKLVDFFGTFNLAGDIERAIVKLAVDPRNKTIETEVINNPVSFIFSDALTSKFTIHKV